jgi:hypothetical protein
MMVMKRLAKCIMGAQIDTIDNIDSNFLSGSILSSLYTCTYIYVRINPFLPLSVGIHSVFVLTFLFLLCFLFFFTFFIF